MSYNPEAQIFQNQVVINDTTIASSTAGGLVVKGGLSTQDTFVTGHVAVNSVKITPNLNDIVNEIQFVLSNDISEFADVTDFSFKNNVTNSFKAQVAITVSTGISKYAIWELVGVYKPSGWQMTSSFTGDITGVNFRIADAGSGADSRGQIQYTNPNTTGTTTIKFRATTTQPPGTAPTGSIGIINNTSGAYIADTLIYANTTSSIASSDITYNSNVLRIGGSARLVGENANLFTNFSNGGAITSMGDASVNNNLIVRSKIGIANTAPTFSLDVGGDINFTGSFYNNGSLYSGSSIWDTNGNNVFYTAGNVGLGTTAPTVRLEAIGDIKASQNMIANLYTGGNISISGTTASALFTGANINISGTSASVLFTGGSMFISGTASATLLEGTTITGGNISISGSATASRLDASTIAATSFTGGSFEMSGNGSIAGNLAVTGSVTSASDMRLKENIQNIEGAMDKIQKCRGVSYTKIATGEKELGFIAQELEEQFPELIFTNQEGYKSVAYGNMTSILLECIKELKKEIAELKARSE